MLSAGMPAHAQIVNGSFEDNYVGWTLEELPPGDPEGCFGTWGIAETGFTLSPDVRVRDFHDSTGNTNCAPDSPSLPITFAPEDGIKLAFQLQKGVQFHRMYQDIDVGPASTLHWDMQYLNHFAGGFDPENQIQYLAVRIRDSSSDAFLEDLFITKRGDSQSNSDPANPRLTPFEANLAAYAGMKVRLSVEIQANRFYLDAQFDNFRLVPNNTCTPPSITSITATPSVIWPPNHKMVPVTVSADASASCGPAVCKIVEIKSDEPFNSAGDGNTSIDTHIMPPLTAEIRAERAGGSLGRTYTITVECKDTADNATRKDTHVFVPHDRRK